MRHSYQNATYQDERGGDAEDRLRQLVRLRAQRGRILTAADEDRLLEEAVTRLGVPLDRAQGILHAEVHNGDFQRETELDDTVSEMMKALAGSKRRLSRRDFEAVASFHAGRRKVPLETSRQTLKRLMEEEDLTPKRAGLLPSKRWYKRIKT